MNDEERDILNAEINKLQKENDEVTKLYNDAVETLAEIKHMTRNY